MSSSSSSSSSITPIQGRGKRFVKRHLPFEEKEQSQPKKQAMTVPSSSSSSHIFKVRDWVCIPIYKNKKRAGVITRIDDSIQFSAGRIKLNATVDINTGGTRPFLVEWPLDKLIPIKKRSKDYDDCLECLDINYLEASSASDSSPSSSPPVASSVSADDDDDQESVNENGESWEDRERGIKVCFKCYTYRRLDKLKNGVCIDCIKEDEDRKKTTESSSPSPSSSVAGVNFNEVYATEAAEDKVLDELAKKNTDRKKSYTIPSHSSASAVASSSRRVDPITGPLYDANRQKEIEFHHVNPSSASSYFSHLFISMNDIMHILKNENGSFDSMEPSCKSVIQPLVASFRSSPKNEEMVEKEFIDVINRLNDDCLYQTKSEKVHEAQNIAIQKLGFWHQDALNSFAWNKWWNFSSGVLPSARRVNDVLTCSDESFEKLPDGIRDYLEPFRGTYKEFIEMALAAKKNNPEMNNADLSSYPFDKFKQKLNQVLQDTKSVLTESSKSWEAIHWMFDMCFYPPDWKNGETSLVHLMDSIAQCDLKNWVAEPMKCE
jgi:hypothetical protein